MTPALALTLDQAAALAVAAVAAAWIARRAWRTFSKKPRGSCACPSASETTGGCGTAGRAGDFKAAAARAVGKASARSGAGDEAARAS